jgi:uncharacterized protein
MTMSVPRGAGLLFLLLLLLLPARPGAAAAQGIDTLRLPVAGGVELLTLVHLPAGAGPHPVVLLRNPYRTRGGAMGWLVERLVPHGYAVVEQDVRGTGGSGGAFRPFVHDVADGTVTLDWLAAQPWAGPIGLWGISYLGWAAYALAETGHPAIGALAVGSAWAEMEPFFAPGGAFNLMAHLTWLAGFTGGRPMPSAAGLDSLFRTLPLAPLLAGAAPIQALGERPFRWDAVTMPVLHFTGWHDYIYTHALHGYSTLRGRDGAGAQRLIVGAWAHNGEMAGQTRVGDVDYGPAAAAGVDSVAAWTRRFFDAHLRGHPEVDAPVRVFVMGENAWRTFDDWPPPGTRVATWHLAADGRLQPAAPRRRGATSFTYDPHAPVPTLGGANSHFFPAVLGPLDQRPLDGRGDVATFLGAPLERPLVLAGPIRAVLHIEADAPATDVAVKLVAVAPDGSARLVEDGIRRVAALRAGVNDVVVDMGHRALRLEPGTRLRLDVTGGNFPKYDRNPNTGEDAWTATALRPVRITVHHGRGRASKLLITARDEG